MSTFGLSASDFISTVTCFAAWAHVICALYIPEVKFGDVHSMDPVILDDVPQDRYDYSFISLLLFDLLSKLMFSLLLYVRKGIFNQLINKYFILNYGRGGMCIRWYFRRAFGEGYGMINRYTSPDSIVHVICARTRALLAVPRSAPA